MSYFPYWIQYPRQNENQKTGSVLVTSANEAKMFYDNQTDVS